MSDLYRAFKNTYRADSNLTEYKNEDTGSSLVGEAALVGTIGAAALYGLGRSGALRYLSDNAHSLGKTISGAVSRFSNEGPLFSRILGEERGDLISNAKRAFSESRSDVISSRKELFNGKTYAELYASRALDAVHSYDIHLNDDYIGRNIMSEFKDRFDDTDKLLNVGKFLGTKFNNEVSTVEEMSSRLTDEFGIHKELADKMSSFTSTLLSNNEGFRATVSNANREKLKNVAIQEAVNKLGSIDDSSKSLITGYKRATVEDLLKANAENRVSIDKKQADFLKEVVDNATDRKGNSIGNKLIADKHVYVDKDGKLIDMRTFPDALRNIGEAYSDTLPAKLFHLRDILNKKDTRIMEFYGTGTSAPHIAHLVNNGDDSPFLNEAVMHIGSGIYRASDLEKLSDNSYRLLSSQYGTNARMTKSMYNLQANRDRSKVFGFVDRNSKPWVKKMFDFLDIGNQEEASTIEQYKGLFAKAHNPNWTRNIIDRSLNGKASKEDYDKIAGFLAEHSTSLSQRTWKQTLDILAQSNTGNYSISQIMMRNNDEIEKTLKYFASKKDVTFKNKRLDWIIKQYNRDPHGFLNRNISVSNKIPIAVFENTRRITGYNIAAREIQKEIFLENAGKVDFREIFKRLHGASKITKEELRNANHLSMFAEFDKTYFKTRTVDDTARITNVKALNELFGSKGFEAEALNAIKNRDASVWQSIAFNDGSRDKINTKYMSMRDDSAFLFGLKSKRAKEALKTISEINNMTKAKAAAKQFGGHLFDVYKELTAGRQRPQDVTALTMTPYFLLERLNEHMSKFGLGFSGKYAGSTAEIAKSYMLRRVLPITLGITALNYIDYRTEAYTGEGLYARGAGAYVNLRVGAQKALDVTGLSKLYKSAWNMMPALQVMNENGPMSAEQLKDHYLNGYDPVRKGRYWGLMMSSTPWFGEGIEYYKPTSYRMIKSGYKYTSSLYGSKDEYWANSWMPTPAHPFAPIRHFITDRYHWENKHKKDRPYPTSAPLFESGTPWGAVLNPTIGELIKPTRHYHREEVNMATGTGIISDINRAIKERVLQREKDKKADPTSYNMAVTDSELGLVPYKFVPDAYAEPNSVVKNYRYSVDGKNVSVSANDTAGVIGARGAATLDAGRAGSSILLAPGKGSKAFSYDLAEINRAIVARGNGSAPTVSGTMLSPSLYKGRASSAVNKDDLLDLTNTGNISDRIGDMTFSAKEITGIWGFFYDMSTETGYSKTKRFANAGAMTSSRRAFWDESLGGLGGPLSEIGRRFIPRFGKEADYYNPIRNTMPLWMPKNFRTGDPYTKAKQGEARLPGGGYESLNKLHPDSFGRYGAFDRFKILADLAPFSDEYKIWKHVAEQTVQSQELKDEMDKIKERVSNQKRQHRLFSYKFKYSDTEKTNVTVAQILDKSTFISHELPGTPIKMAGVDFRSEGLDIKNVIREGQVLTIEYAKDKGRKFNKDTYGSLNAVVYSGGSNLNRVAIQNGLGKEKENDFSPAGVHARFTKGTVATGKILESIGHNNSIPFLSFLNDKILRIRSPYEEYERTEIYGRPYGSWAHPISSYLIPSFQKAFSKGIIGGGIRGGFIGVTLAVPLLGAFKGRMKIAAGIGAAIGALGGLRNDISKLTGNGPWIPKEVKKRREVEEYFDKLKYVKYSRLYERARKLAYKYEHVNIEKMIRENKESADENSRVKNRFKSAKQNTYVYGSNDTLAEAKAKRDKMKYINQQIEGNADQKVARQAGKMTMAALMYREEMNSTMTGLTKDSSWANIIKALPKRDKEYFMEFADTPEPERKKILQLVTKQQAQLLKRIWGQGNKDSHPIRTFIKEHIGDDANWFLSKVKNIIDYTTDDVQRINEKAKKNIELNHYFATHAMPSKRWAGWRPDVSVDQVKMKTMDHYKVDIGGAGYTEKDLEQARQDAPPAFDINKHSNFLISHIKDLLSTSGLSDVNVVAIPTQQSGINVRFDMMSKSLQNIGDTISSMIM